MFKGLGEDLVKEPGRQSTMKDNKSSSKLSKGFVLSSYKSQVNLAQQKLEDLIPGISIKKNDNTHDRPTKQSLNARPLKTVDYFRNV